MGVRAAMLAVLCLGLNACTTSAAEQPSPGAPVVAGGPVPSAAPVSASAGARADAMDDVIAVRKAGTVSVVARLDGKPLWSVPQRPDDPIAKARLAQGSIVVVRQSATAEVYDLKTGTLRFSKDNAGAIGVSWTMLYADSVVCQPDCQLRGYDLATGSERWVGPKSLPGKVMAEPGESPDHEIESAAELARPLRAPEASVIAVRTAEGVLLLDAASGQELARTPVPEVGMALGSGQILLAWTAVKDCKVNVTGRNIRTGEIVWQAEVATRLLGQVSLCFGGYWRPDITDGLITVFPTQGSAKAIEIDTGKVYWTAGSGDRVVAVSRGAVIVYGPGQVTAVRPDKDNSASNTRLWAAGMSRESKVTGAGFDFDRLLYTTVYEGSPHGIGWVRDSATGRRLWVADGATPLGLDGDRVIVETPSGEIRLDRMVSTG